MSPPRSFKLHRRTMLRGLLGGSLVAMGLPALDAMMNSHGTAFADGSALPKRFMTWFFGNGVKLARWTPAGAGAGSAWEITEELAPLANVKSHLSVLSGFNNLAGYGRRGHHDGVAGMFSGHPFIELDPGGANYSSKFGGPSIDQVAVSRLAKLGVSTYLPSLHVGVSKRLTDVEGPTLHHIAHKGPDESIASVHSPVDVYDQLFGNFVPAGDPEGPLRVKMLDAVSADAKRLRARVGSADRARLDAHLDSLSALEKKITALPPVCTKPGAPTATNEDQDGNEPLEETAKVMADLVAIAWSCDITRVTTWQQSGSVGGTVYWMNGDTVEEHGLSHEDAGQEQVHKAVVFNMTCLAYLLEKLHATPEGEGSNLLDNAVILVGSDCAEGLTHSCFDQPILVAGKGGGAIKSDQHYRSSDDPGAAENTSDVLLACLQVLDPSATEVGADQGYSNTPCAALKA
ncbi:MAG: DUF1552 domain-containing protein [Polyangiaceae bacterium]